jgi:type I restriction-modification system DNA methylase subunit
MKQELQKLLWNSYSKLHLLGIREDKASNFLLFNYVWHFMAHEYHVPGPSFSQESLDGLLQELRKHIDGDADTWHESIREFYKAPNSNFDDIINEWNRFFDDSNDLWSAAIINEVFEAFENTLARTRHAHLYFTPPDVVQLISGVVDSQNAQTVYDPFCRSGDLLNKAKSDSRINAVGETPDSFSLRIAKARFLLLGIDNVELLQKSPIGFREPEFLQRQFDLVVTNPPFGKLPTNTQIGNGHFSARYKMNDMALAFFTHSLDSLTVDGQLAIILPAGIMSNSGGYVDFKRELIENNILEAVIQLPQKIFYATAVHTSLWLVNKQKKKLGVLLVDLSKKAIKSKDRYELTNDALSMTGPLIKQFRSATIIDEDSQDFLIATLEELEAANYNLSFDYIYNCRSGEQMEYTPSTELWMDCANIQSRVDAIQNEMSALVDK